MLFMIMNISDSSNCISLYNRSAAWFDAPTTSTTYKVNASWVSGWWPAKGEFEKPVPHQPKWALHCSSKREGFLPWTGCQSKTVVWTDKGYFTFSPGISTSYNRTFAGRNFTDQDPVQVTTSNPVDLWLLCGINGSCTDLTPFVMIGGGVHGVATFSWSSSEPFR